MTNRSRRDAAARKVLAAARSIVTYQIGLPAGCQRMRRMLASLRPHATDLPPVFEAYMQEVQGLPIGSERLHWDREVLREKDVVLEATNQRFRDQIFDACWTIVDRLTEAEPGPSSP